MKYIFHRRTRERDDIMRKILRNIIENKRFDLENNIESECLLECINRGYITGIHAHQTINNEPCFDICGNLSVTYAGVQFLENKHPNWQTTLNTVLSLLAIVISIFSALLVLLANFQDIQNNLSSIIELFANDAESIPHA